VSFSESGLDAPRIHGELLKLGINVGETTVAKYLVRPCLGHLNGLSHRMFVQGHHRCLAQAEVTGPNVVLNFGADQRGVAPHQRWATGLLTDSSQLSAGLRRPRSPQEAAEALLSKPRLRVTL
jgi:hypothetical protein